MLLLRLVVSWLNSAFSTLFIVLVIYYFSHFSPWPLPVLAVFLVCESVSAVGFYAETWMAAKGASLRWSAAIIIFVTAVQGLVQQLFLLHRCRRLGTPQMIIMALICMALSNAAFSFYAAILVASSDIDPTVDRYASKAVGIVAVVFSSVDILIPIALSFRLFTLTTPALAKERNWSASVVNAVSSGKLGSLFTIILMILYGASPIANYLFYTTLGRIYGITLFTNLIVSNRGNNREINDNELFDLPRTTSTTTGTITIFNRNRRHSSAYPTSASLHSLNFTGKEKALPPTPLTATVFSSQTQTIQVRSPALKSECEEIDTPGSTPTVTVAAISVVKQG